MSLRVACSLALVWVAAAAPSQVAPLSLEARIADLRRYATAGGDQLWPGYGAAPFEMLIVREQGETLLCRDAAPDGFAEAGSDGPTGCARRTRARSDLPLDLLAAMPLFGPPSTIVMGTPDATGLSPADWSRTVLHEHFHQWQASLPSYYARVAALDLAGGDKTGMWMLDFAFPYADATVARAYAQASVALADALDARGRPGLAVAAQRFLRARAAFAAAAGPRNWRYLEFQLWQEGVARWTDVELAERHPDPAVRASGGAARARVLAALRRPDLVRQKRELAYPFGAGEAMLLDACDPTWRLRYPRALSLGALWTSAARRCAGSAGRS